VQARTVPLALSWTMSEAGLDGSSPHTIVTGQTPGGGVAADTSLYWSSLGGTAGNATIDEGGLDGTSPHPIVAGLSQPAGVASNASNIYWADASDGTINQADPDGTSSHPIVTGQTAPMWVAVAPAAPQLAFTPAPFSYGRASPGQAAAQQFTLFSSGEAATGLLTVTVSGSAAFAVTSDTCTGTSLGPGQRCLVTVRFAPSSAGPVTATLMTASQEPAATPPMRSAAPEWVRLAGAATASSRQRAAVPPARQGTVRRAWPVPSPVTGFGAGSQPIAGPGPPGGSAFGRADAEEQRRRAASPGTGAPQRAAADSRAQHQHLHRAGDQHLICLGEGGDARAGMNSQAGHRACVSAVIRQVQEPP
jgi:hypothetical protein